MQSIDIGSDLPLDECELVHISHSNVVHSILCLNLLLLIINHMTRPETGYEIASCLNSVLEVYAFVQRRICILKADMSLCIGYLFIHSTSDSMPFKARFTLVK